MNNDQIPEPENTRLTYRMQERIFPGPDGRNRLSLRFKMNSIPGGTSVGNFLRNELHFSKRQISSLKFREDGIRVNGQMQRVSCILRSGDELEIVPKSAGSLYLDHGTFTEPPNVLYEDSELLIVSKPSGMVCHPSPGHYADTLANQTAAYCAGKNESWTIRLVGRLDKDTSGIVVFAKNSECAARLSAPASIEKEYRAIACGTLPASGEIRLPIAPDEEVLGKMKTDPAGKPAETYFETLEVFEDRSLLKVRLVHGRTHQIRLHLSAIGHPLVGDALYGTGIPGETHAFLHCRSIRLIHPFSGEALCITAPFPADWPVRFSH